MKGWAEANGPGNFVWLGLDSALIRYRDIAGPSYGPPYHLRADAVAGRPGGASEPKIYSLLTVAWGLGVCLLGIIALFGGKAGALVLRAKSG